MTETNATDVLARLWERTTVGTGSCWLWTGSVDGSGYGRISVGGRMRGTHRVGYAILGRDELTGGQVLHHRCRVRRCWNPDHLEQTTTRRNTLLGDGPTARHARATHCPQRHEYTEDNTRHARGRRHCRACHRERLRQNRANRRSAGAST